jgi:hypothetical protein
MGATYATQGAQSTVVCGTVNGTGGTTYVHGDPVATNPNTNCYVATTSNLGAAPAASGGGGGGTGSVAPSKVGCSTVLPNGNTVGQYINQGRAQLQAIVDRQNEIAASGGDINPLAVITAFAGIARDYGQIDFKNGAAGSGGNSTVLGQAGNFAYYAIGSGYLSPTTLDVGASVYSHASVLLGRKSLSSLTGPLGIDASAASVKNAALATPGCPN